MAYIKEQTLVFSTGRRLSAQRGVIGISPSQEVFQGHSGVLVPKEPFLDDDDALSDAERVELADFMIKQWKSFKAMSAEDA